MFIFWVIVPNSQEELVVNRNTDLGKSFFKAVATPASVKKILCEVSMEDLCKRSSSFIGFYFMDPGLSNYSIYFITAVLPR